MEKNDEDLAEAETFAKQKKAWHAKKEQEEKDFDDKNKSGGEDTCGSEPPAGGTKNDDDNDKTTEGKNPKKKRCWNPLVAEAVEPSHAPCLMTSCAMKLVHCYPM